MQPREFLEELQGLIAAFRQKIELEVDAFPVDPKARTERVKRVMEPDGYRYFVETYLPHYLGKDPSCLHEELYRDLPVMIAKPEGQKKLVIAPRGSAKSTHISLAFPLWCIVTGRKHYLCLIMDAFEQTAVMVEALKAELEVNPRLSYDFPKVAGQGRLWREGVIITRNNIKVEAFGTGKKIRGRRHGPWRPDLVILDDVENDENVESPRQRDKLESWIAKAVMKLGPTDGTMDVLYAGTVLHFDAVILRFAQKPGWEVARYQAVIKWPDRMDLWDQWEELYLNNEDEAASFWRDNRSAMETGAVLNWPAMHSLIFLMQERAGDHESFESEYQNAPLNASGAFKNITFWALKKREWVLFGGIDPSLGKAGKGRDPSAILIGGYDRLEGVFDVVEASIRKRLPSVIIADAIAMQREYNCLLWFVEAIQFQEFLMTELMASAAKMGVAMPCVPIKPYADKSLRIERLQPPIASGLIRLHSSQRTLIDQLQQYPSAAHDDGPDCLEMLWQNALHYGGGGATGGMMTASGSFNGGATADTLGDYRL